MPAAQFNYAAPNDDQQIDGVITEWTVANPADNVFRPGANDRRELFRVRSPFFRHTIQEIAFNPTTQVGMPDYGLLYIAVGDSGAMEADINRPYLLRRDGLNFNLDSILGTILCIDPLGHDGYTGQYGIPDNPFAHDGDPYTLGEIYAYGYRVDRIVLRLSDDAVSGDGPPESLRQSAPPMSCVFLAGDEDVVMEAEHFSSQDALRDPQGLAWEVRLTPSALGNKYVTTPDHDRSVAQWEEGAELSYRIAFATTGTYHIWLRRFVDDTQDNSGWVGLDGVQVQGAHQDDGLPGSWEWVNLGTVDITAPGERTLQLRRRESDYRVDRIVLRNSDATVFGAGPAESTRMSCRLEAEDAFISQPGRAEVVHPGFSGTGYANYANDMGSFVRWQLPDITRQAYALAFRYANGATQDRSMHIVLDHDGEVVEGNLSFPPTHAWSDWQLQTTTTRVLQSGDHTIQAVALQAGGGPNVDYLEMAPVVEAEDADDVDGNRESEHAGFTGIGYVNFANRSGSGATWTVTVPEAGLYMLTFRYANGSTSDRPMSIRANDIEAESDLLFPSTTTWTNWVLARAIVFLKAGDNTIVAMALESAGGPNLDHIGVSFVSR